LALESKVALVLLSNLSDESLERKLANEKLSLKDKRLGLHVPLSSKDTEISEITY
jgi:hypothetical protein